MRADQAGRQAGATAHGERQAREGGGGKNLGTVGRICATLPGSLLVGRCRLD